MPTPLPVLSDAARAPVPALAADPDVAATREAALVAWLRARGRVLLGYSGGVDSAYLAVVARRALGRDGVVAVLGRSASVPEEQLAVARAVAATHDVPLLEHATDELDDPDYAANPSDRCYHCKKVLWRHLVPLAEGRGIATVIDGTNADDLHDHRPGGRAATERGVSSPLAALGFTKDEIRLRSQALGLATWDRPSAPCLASRLPYGTAVTAARLAQVERAEQGLRALGLVGDLRVRHHGDLARIELPTDGLAACAAPTRLAALASAVRAAGFARVALDLTGFRRGSLNVLEGLRPDPALPVDPAAAAAAAWAATCAPPALDGRMAVWTVPDAPQVVGDPARRAALVARARGLGATHVAVALPS